jgi:hypothetical protein
MKYTFILIIALFIGENAFAQTEFMPIGAKLFTKAKARGLDGFATIASEKDTIHNGAACRKIVITCRDIRDTSRVFTKIFFTQQRGDSIFDSQEHTNVWYFRFKNFQIVGDSILLNQTPTLLSRMYIDSMIASNGIKCYFARTVRIDRSSIKIDTLIYDLKIYDKFFPDGYFGSEQNDLIKYTSLCYTDNVTSYQTTNYTGFCDYIPPTTAVKEIPNNLKIYPNPAQSFVTIESTQTQSVALKIQDINGVVLRQKTGLTPMNLDIQDLPNGIYFLSTQDDKGSTTQKLVIQH